MGRLSVVVMALGLALVTACDGGSAAVAPSSVPASPVSATPTPSAAVVRLGEVPGLGDTEILMVRDDTIAYWEAWKRAELVNACMAAAGFRWVVDVNYPGGAVPAIAGRLGVDPQKVDGLTPTEQNRRYRRSLSHARLDDYSQALFAESADDVAYVNDHRGQLPPGRRGGRPFAEGGCVGDAAKLVGTVWQLKRELAEDLITLRKTAAQGLTAEILQQYPRIAEQLTDYSQTMASIEGDRDFLTYLAQAAGRASEV